MKTMMPRHHADVGRGFTLLELLVVVSIIILLLSLLTPALNQVVHTGRMVQCASNLRSIGQAAFVYAGDHDGVFSDTVHWILFQGGGHPWDANTNRGVRAGDLYPYMGYQDRAYLCPEFVRVCRLNLNPANAGLTPYYSYSMNAYFRQTRQPPINPDGGWQGFGLLRRSNIKYMSELALFSEENPYVTWTPQRPTGYNAYAINDPNLGPVHTNTAVAPLDPFEKRKVIDGLANYHRPQNPDLLSGDGYANVSFMDGSLKQVHASRTVEVFTPRDTQ